MELSLNSVPIGALRPDPSSPLCTHVYVHFPRPLPGAVSATSLPLMVPTSPHTGQEGLFCLFYTRDLPEKTPGSLSTKNSNPQTQG